jgi:uncharacterized protein (DUF1015 family)
VAVLYRITAPGEPAAYGLWAMVDTDQISTSADEPGLVIRNEDVFIAKVRERVALAEALQTLLSPVLLLQTGKGDALHAALAAASEVAGSPAATDTDQSGRTHAIWVIPAGPLQQELTTLAGGGELVVADGNHRSLAAQTGGLPRFLAVVTTPASVAIQPYNRLVAELPVAGLAERLTAAGARVEELPRPAAIPAKGTVELYAAGKSFSVVLPPAPGASPVESLDHALVERILFGEVLDLEPGDKRISYVGGDYSAEWLRAEVDAGRSELAVLIAPVTVDDFVAVNLARQKMPRKSTWFTPKARAGLVVAELGA